MFSSSVRSFEDFNKITDLNNKINKVLQNFTAARITVRDYIIRQDDKYFRHVEQRIALATETLAQAEFLADNDEDRHAIRQLRDAIRAWSIIARQVHNAFTAFQDVAKQKIPANFQRIAQVCCDVARNHPPFQSSLMLNAQTAHAAIISHLVNGDDQFAHEAWNEIASAKEKITQFERLGDVRPVDLETLSTSLYLYAEGLQDAVDSRKNAYTLFEDHLSPLGDQIQCDIEKVHERILVYQEKNDEMRLNLMAELHHAIEHNELALCFQPKINLCNGTVESVEALIQWLHPQRGFVRPDQFIPFAENTGYITAISRWVIDHALRQSAAWRAHGIAINIAVNVSARDLVDLGFPALIGHLLDTHHATPDWLSLEITESAIMGDPERSEKVLQALRNMDLKLSIDDYGTGYASLSYLKKLKARELKIDKSFVMDMAEDPHSVMIVRSTIELGHNLGLKVVAEGVEDLTTLELLTAMGCDYAQGYHISRPLKADQLEQWLAESKVLPSWNVGAQKAAC